MSSACAASCSLPCARSCSITPACARTCPSRFATCRTAQLAQSETATPRVRLLRHPGTPRCTRGRYSHQYVTCTITTPLGEHAGRHVPMQRAVSRATERFAQNIRSRSCVYDE
eukprot:1101316-Prorocentrum_minimum.AAC.1